MLFILKFLFFIFVIFLLLVFLVAFALVSLKRLLFGSGSSQTGAPRYSNDDEVQQVESRPCQYCGTFVSEQPQIDALGVCNLCGKQLQKIKK